MKLSRSAACWKKKCLKTFSSPIFPPLYNRNGDPNLLSLQYHMKLGGIKYIHAAAAATKSLQSCPTLCDPIDGSQGSNLGLLRWEHRVSSMGPPGKSMVLLFSSLPFNQSSRYAGTLSNFVRSQRWYVASPGFSSGLVASEPLSLHTCWRTSRGSSLTSCVVLGVTLDFPEASVFHLWNSGIEGLDKRVIFTIWALTNEKTSGKSLLDVWPKDGKGTPRGFISTGQKTSHPVCGVSEI